ncbi:MAG: outer membrane protein assembly factor BamD [Gammaproteobacteria bacterium]|jgi:outer membrane protein assembly factor BamD
MTYVVRNNSFLPPFIGSLTRARLPTGLVTVLLSMLLLLGGCATTGDEEGFKSWPAEKLYKEAKNEMEAGDYELAIEYLETLEARYPFGELAEQAQLETAYAYYKFEEYDSAIAAADRFIKLHPRHPKVDYAYYLRGLAAYHKNDTPYDIIATQDPSERDPGSTRDSFNYFAELVKKFPKSKYVPDAIKRMKYQRNLLAKHEIHIANYYMKRGAYVAAANRAKYVVENYSQTPAVADALTLLTQAYKNLKMDDLAADTKRVLKKNYPDFKNNNTEE